jgi:hypothetical protein
MSDSIDKKVKRPYFLVYIIESPSPVDLYHRRYEGEALSKALTLANIKSEHKLVVNEEAFQASLLIGLDETLKDHPDHLPIIHISAHGSNEGIQLTDETTIDWKGLKESLAPINKAFDGLLLLCMSSCHGFSACRMAMEEDDAPFAAVIGNSGNPTWSDTAVGYAAFYHLINKGKSFEDAVEGMCKASGDDNFIIISAHNAHQVYMESLQSAEQGKIEATVNESIDKLPTRDLEKALEKKK